LKEVQHEYCVLAGMCPNNQNEIYGSQINCVDGKINAHEGYDCQNVNLRSYVSNDVLGSIHDANDIWGAQLYDNNGVLRFLAIVGLEDGSSYVDITDSLNPKVLGFLPSHKCSTCGTVTIWRDIKVFNNYAFVVSENRGHGMQVVDLQALINSQLPTPIAMTEDAHYGEFGNCHNLAINTDSGYAYAVGTATCRGGLHIVDINDPLNPTFAGCYSADGYTHDTQCVNYQAPYPDSRYYGKEICYAFNEDTLTIVDVTDKLNIVLVSRTGYNGFQYTHQGWVTPDGRFIYMDDELDEYYGTTFPQNGGSDDGARTRTLIWNADDLQNPKWVNTFSSPKTVIDHNQYINHGHSFQSNYCGGLRVLDVANPLATYQHGYFDLAPYCDGPVFQGSWSNYPYYVDHPDDVTGKTLTVVVTSIERGLYVVEVLLNKH